MKSIFEMTEKEAEFHCLMEDANEAKDCLANIASALESAGYHRKAKSAMTLVYAIEEWQNRK